MPARGSAPLLTRRVLNRTLLARQHLLERVERPPGEILEQLVGLQAQEPQDPYVGLWTRLSDFDPAQLSAHLERREVVRMGLMRTTLHLVTTRDALGLAPLLQPVLLRAVASTAVTGRMGAVDPDAVVAAARDLVEAAPRTPKELGVRLAERFPEGDPTAMALLARFRLPLVQVPPRGLWRRTGRAMNTTLETWTGQTPAAYPLEEVLSRYLRAFGPASTADMRTWSWCTGLRPVIDRLRPRLRTYRDERGRELFDVEDGEIADPDLPAPVRFLPQFDNVFLSHDDRSRINGSLAWGLHFAWKGVVLIDGWIEATWRVRRDRSGATMTVEAGRRLTAAERKEVEAEAERLARFLDPEAPASVVLAR